MGHFVGDDHGELYEAAEGAVDLVPDSLIDYLAFAFFGDGVSVGASFCQKTADLCGYNPQLVF